LKICIAGGTGLIGSAVKIAAERAGHDVTVIHVPRPGKKYAHLPESWIQALEVWTPDTFSGYDALMFFGGESIATRWTPKKRQRIELSRQAPCRRMASCAAAAQAPPAAIVSASASGFYGDRGEEALTESTGVGNGFLASTTATWEATWESASNAGIRVALLRFGVVLSPDGGALKVMLPAFKAALGGRMGSGRQWMSWISLHDAARLAVWAAENPDVSGPVNAVAPAPVRQMEFAKALGRAIHRPAIAPVPGPILKALFGEMAKDTILISFRALPQKALDTGFQFDHSEIDSALVAIL